LRLVVKIGLFLLPLAALAGWFEVELRAMPNSYTIKQRLLEEQQPQVETLVLGASNAFYGINPRFMDEHTLNLANVSEPVRYNAYLARQAAERLPRLSLVIVCPAFHAMETRLEASQESWRAFHYHHFMGVPLPEETSLTDTRRWSLLALYTPKKAFELALHGFRNSVADPISPSGWAHADGNAPSEPLTFASGAKRVLFHKRMMRPEYFEANRGHLDELFRGLSARQIHGAIVVTPVFHTYSDQMDPVARKRSVDAFEQLAESHGIVYRDYLTDPRFDAADFRDADHMNEHGAEKLSRILNAEVVRPVARQ